ncbi:hypothetical protein F4777DRAFT_527877 [Nemania sp. FL0916]|nr:hypothetical protein F4777DRAFT_527877 [Nemania sp. FL0916]
MSSCLFYVCMLPHIWSNMIKFHNLPCRDFSPCIRSDLLAKANNSHVTILATTCPSRLVFHDWLQSTSVSSI